MRPIRRSRPSLCTVLPISHLGSLPEDVTSRLGFHLDPLTLVAVVLDTGALPLAMRHTSLSPSVMKT